MTSNLAALQEHKEKNVSWAFLMQKEYGCNRRLLSDGLVTYNSTPEMSSGQQVIGSRCSSTSNQAGQLTIDLGLCNT